MRLLTGGTIASEKDRQTAILDRLERRYARQFRAEIRQAMTEAIDGWEITGEVPILRDHASRVEHLFRSLALDAVIAFGSRIISQGKSARLLERKENWAARFFAIALRYIAGEAVRRRITAITETTRADIIRMIATGFQDGLGTVAIARRIRSAVPEISQTRGVLIARTETHGAAMHGADATARETGLQLRKQWIAVEDARTRPHHVQAGIDYAEDGPIGPIGMDQPFIVGGEALMFPGDPAGSPWNTIACRCVVTHHVIDDD